MGVLGDEDGAVKFFCKLQMGERGFGFDCNLVLVILNKALNVVLCDD